MKEKISQYHLHKENPEKLQFEWYDLKTYRKKNRIKAAIPHSHSYYQMIYFSEGGGKHNVDFKTYELKPNTLFFITKDQIHAFDDNLEIEGWLIHFNESLFRHSDVALFLKYSIFHANQNPFYTISQELRPTLNSYIDLIKREIKQKSGFKFDEVVRFLLKALLINLERINQNKETKKPVLNKNNKERFFAYKELIETNYKKGLTVNEYANLLRVSTKTLSTVTKYMVNKVPSEIIRERIILEAKRLLKFTQLQVGEIAYKLGFEDPSYFIKYFKRAIGESPKRFRENI